ncbi:MAG: phospholipase [Pseudomonadota bacterium]|nr:phospholipase [Pseudomonadota bacterium]
MSPLASPIEHVVVLMMENAAFDRMLGCMTEVHSTMDGVDPVHPHTNPDPDDGDVAQAPTTSRNIDRDPKHYLPNGLAQLAGGTNQGFVADFARTHPNSTSAERREIMGYYPRGFLPALHTLAEQFVVCDHWFSSLPGPTWINRLFAHAGTSLGHVSEPGSLFSSKLHLYNERTLYDELHDAGVPWRIYFGDVPQSLVLTHQIKHLASYRRFAHWHDDIAKGDLPSYTFIEPTYFGPNENDQHPPHDVLRGDALIADVYNTLRANPALFARSLLIVMYDEHGGFFDHVVPPHTLAPDSHTDHYSFDRLGFRVPAVFISPLLDPGVVQEVFDHTSLLRMASGLWKGVQPLGRRAKQANDPLASLTWRTSPRRAIPEAPMAPDIQDPRVTDRLLGFKESLFGLSHHIESLIEHPGRRGELMARTHEALGDGWSQAKLATDRLDALFAESASRGLLHRVGHVLQQMGRRVGL